MRCPVVVMIGLEEGIDGTVRWTLIGVLWLALMFRLFGRGTSGQRHGLFNWYDWVVIAFGAALLWTLQFA